MRAFHPALRDWTRRTGVSARRTSQVLTQCTLGGQSSMTVWCCQGISQGLQQREGNFPGGRYRPFSGTSALCRAGEGSREVTIDGEGGTKGVRHLVLNRPKANALSRGMVESFVAALERIGDDDQARVLVISSAVNGVFCAGADLKERALMKEEEVAAFVTSLRGLMSRIEQLPLPTVAAVEGAALGGGLELMLSCDIRVIGRGAVMGLPETSLAIIPGAGGTQRLPRLVGPSAAKELIFTAERLGAERALQLGLVSHVTPEGAAVDKALEVACKIAANGPIAVRAAKRAINSGMQAASLEEGLALEGQCYADVIHTEDRREGLSAFRDKRPPEYTGT